eukprot:337178-Pelagomonas_calceolata.AAC.1
MSPLTSDLPTPRQISCRHGNVIFKMISFIITVDHKKKTLQPDTSDERDLWRSSEVERLNMGLHNSVLASQSPS